MSEGAFGDACTRACPKNIEPTGAVAPERAATAPHLVQSLQERYAAVCSRLDDAVRWSGRVAGSVQLVAISKFQTAEAMAVIAACGQRAFGENYAQEARAKREALQALGAGELAWHFTGHAQTNKAKELAGQFALIHAVDSERLGAALARRMPAAGVQPVLIQVNVGEEAQKSGVAPADLLCLGEQLAAMPALRVQGLMCLPPRCGEGEAARPYFAMLRVLRDKLAAHLGLSLPHLSMGMSGDFEQAIAEGASHVRIGTDIFGARP